MAPHICASLWPPELMLHGARHQSCFHALERTVKTKAPRCQSLRVDEMLERHAQLTSLHGCPQPAPQHWQQHTRPEPDRKQSTVFTVSPRKGLVVPCGGQNYDGLGTSRPTRSSAALPSAARAHLETLPTSSLSCAMALSFAAEKHRPAPLFGGITHSAGLRSKTRALLARTRPR